MTVFKQECDRVRSSLQELVWLLSEGELEQVRIKVGVDALRFLQAQTPHDLILRDGVSLLGKQLEDQMQLCLACRVVV